jgi:hypothetical protein
MKIADAITYIGLISVAVIEAINETLKLEPKVVASLPPFLTSSLWHFVPLLLLTVVFLIWLARQLGWIDRGDKKRIGIFSLWGFKRRRFIKEIQPLFNSWLQPAAETGSQILQRVMLAMRGHPDPAVSGHEGLVQRSIADEERAALSRLSNALRAIEPTNPNDLQDRLGAYYRTYQHMRTYIALEARFTGASLQGDSIFQEWTRLDERFLAELRQFAGPLKYDRLKAKIKEVGWSENVTRELRELATNKILVAPRSVTDRSLAVSINPLDDKFVKQKIKLADFFDPKYAKATKNAKFQDCDLHGPATIWINGGSLDNCGFGSCNAVIVRDGPVSGGVTVFETCIFERCSFFDATLLLGKNHYLRFKEQVGEGILLVSDGTVGEL